VPEVPQENSGRIGGFEKGEFARDSARKEVAAQICVRRADMVQLRAQKIDEPTKIRIPQPITELADKRQMQLRRLGTDGSQTLHGHGRNADIGVDMGRGSPQAAKRPGPAQPAR